MRKFAKTAVDYDFLKSECNRLRLQGKAILCALADWLDVLAKTTYNIYLGKHKLSSNYYFNLKWQMFKN